MNEAFLVNIFDCSGNLKEYVEYLLGAEKNSVRQAM